MSNYVDNRSMFESIIYCLVTNGTLMYPVWKKTNKFLDVFMANAAFSVTSAACLVRPYTSVFRMRRFQPSSSQREAADQTANTLPHCSYFYLLSTRPCLLLWLAISWSSVSVYRAAGAVHAELRGHRTAAGRSRPLCSDTLLRERRFSLHSGSPNTNANMQAHFFNVSY